MPQTSNLWLHIEITITNQKSLLEIPKGCERLLGFHGMHPILPCGDFDALILGFGEVATKSSLPRLAFSQSSFQPSLLMNKVGTTITAFQRSRVRKLSVCIHVTMDGKLPKFIYLTFPSGQKYQCEAFQST